MDWRTNAPKDRMLDENTYSVEAVRALDTHHTPIQKQLEMLLCLVRISRRYYLGDKMYPTFLHDDDRGGYGLVQFNSCPKSHKDGGTGRSYRLIGCTIYHREVPLGLCQRGWGLGPGNHGPEVPQPEDVPATSAPKVGQAEEVDATDPFTAIESRKRGHDGADVNAPLKVLRKDHVDPRPTGSTHGGKSLTAIELDLASTRPVHVPENSPAGVSDPYPLSFADPQSSKGTAIAGDPDSGNASFSFVVGYPKNKKPGGIAGGRGRHEEGHRRHECGAKPRIRRYACPVLRPSSEQRASIPAGCHPTRAAMSRDGCALGCHCGSPIGNGTRAAPCHDEIHKSLELSQAFANVVSVGIAKGMSEGLRHGVEHGQAQLSLESIEAYDPEVEAKYVATLQASKDLKYPLVDQLEGLKDAPMDVIMATLSDGVPVSVPTMVPQGLAILLADAATQMELEEAT
nr:hypothetical protein [Tanacetum cinerariifolium]